MERKILDQWCVDRKWEYDTTQVSSSITEQGGLCMEKKGKYRTWSAHSVCHIYAASPGLISYVAP